MMHMQSKKEHNIANCPNEALKNRFRAESLSVATGLKRLEVGGFNLVLICIMSHLLQKFNTFQMFLTQVFR